jgi:hypothetical protein
MTNSADFSTVIDDDAALAAAIGRATAHWSALELDLVSFFNLFSGLRDPHGPAIFGFFKSVRTQGDMILTLANLYPSITPESFAALSAFLRDYQAASGKRNRLLHNPFGLNDDGTSYQVVRRKQFRRDEKWYELRNTSEAEINAFSEEVKTLRAKGFDLWRRFLILEIHGLRNRVRSRLPARKAKTLLQKRPLPLRHIVPNKPQRPRRQARKPKRRPQLQPSHR